MSMTQIFNKIYANNKSCCSDLKNIHAYLEELEKEKRELQNEIMHLQAKLKQYEGDNLT